MSTTLSSKRAGERGEAAVVDVVEELTPVPDQEAEHYDAEPVRPIWPSERLPTAGLAVLERGIPVEIKTAIPRLTSGRRGRFYLRREQHERLEDDGGAYLFAVVTPHDREPLAMKAAAARSVEDVIPSWIDGHDRADYAQVRLSSVFRPEEVKE